MTGPGKVVDDGTYRRAQDESRHDRRRRAAPPARTIGAGVASPVTVHLSIRLSWGADSPMTGSSNDETFDVVSCLTEAQAREFVENIRWPNGPVCPHCLSVNNSMKLAGRSSRPGLYKCRNPNCRKQFTVTIGTLFEHSHIPLRTWLAGFALLCARQSGISALQLQRDLGLVSYHSAWRMAHRLRHAMRREPLASLLRSRRRR